NKLRIVLKFGINRSKTPQLLNPFLEATMSFNLDFPLPLTMLGLVLVHGPQLMGCVLGSHVQEPLKIVVVHVVPETGRDVAVLGKDIFQGGHKPVLGGLEGVPSQLPNIGGVVVTEL